MSTPRQFRTGIDVYGQPIIGLASPTNPTDAANKGYVDNALQGLAWKQPVRAASTTNVAFASAVANGGTLDGVTLTTGMRILLKDQTTGSENGIYTVNASGAPTRATDADSTAELQNATAYVIAGSVNADRAYTQTANDPVIGTTALTWAQVGGGTVYANGAGLNLSGTTFSVNADGTTLVADGTNLRISPTYSGRALRYAVTLPAGSGSQTVTHNLNTTDIQVTLQDLVTGGTITEFDGTVSGHTANTVNIDAGTVAANSVRVIIGA